MSCYNRDRSAFRSVTACLLVAARFPSDNQGCHRPLEQRAFKRGQTNPDLTLTSLALSSAQALQHKRVSFPCWTPATQNSEENTEMTMTSEYAITSAGVQTHVKGESATRLIVGELSRMTRLNTLGVAARHLCSVGR